MGSEAGLLWSVLFGAVGMAYFMYARRQREPVALICAIGLMVFPYFVNSTLWMVLIGAALTAAPWFLR